MQLWSRQTIKHVYCRVFIPVSTGIKHIKIHQEMPEL